MTENPKVERVRPIGFGKRLAAIFVDGFVLMFLSFILLFAAGIFVPLLSAYSYTSENPFPADTVLLLIGLATSIIYYVGFWTKSGQTIGKSAVGIKVVGHDGEPISVGKALIRYIGYIISGVVLALGFIWILFDRKRQGWHDKLAGTFVIDVDEEFTDAAAVEFVTTDSGARWGWLVIWIVIALAAPAAFFLSIWFLGPALRGIVTDLLQSIL